MPIDPPQGRLRGLPPRDVFVAVLRGEVAAAAALLLLAAPFLLAVLPAMRQREINGAIYLGADLDEALRGGAIAAAADRLQLAEHVDEARSEERRVGKECRSRWSPY